MRKFIKLTFDFFGSIKLNAVVLAIICTLMWCALAFMYGRYIYYGDRYEKLESANIEDDLYFSVVLSSASDVDKVRESILAIDGVVNIIERPESIKYNGKDSSSSTEITFQAIRITEELYEKFEPIIKKGKGFDYSSPEIEMIITEQGEDEWQEIGSEISVNLGVDENGNAISETVSIVGIADQNQFYPVMSGGGTEVTADLILSQTSFFLIKESEQTKDLLDKMFPQGNKSIAVYSGLVELEDDITEAKKQAVIESISKFCPVNEGTDILFASEKRMNEDMSSYLPIALFFVVFFVATLVCLTVLSIYKYADEYAVWRVVGASKRDALAITFTTFALIIVASVLISLIIISGVTSSTFFITYLEETIIGKETYAAMASLAALTLMIVALISYSSVKVDNLRLLKSKYKE